MKSSILALSATLAALAAFVGCGGSVEQTSSSAGSGGAGGATASSTGEGACAPDSCSGPSTSSSSSTGQGGSGGSTCDGLFESACLAASPDCAPVYDDKCCPTCDPGPCADCQDMVFHHCAPTGEVCTKTPSCGTTPTWACAGTQATCPSITDPSDTYQCEATAGCVVATCSPDVNCVDVECHPVTAGSCTSMCDIPAPSCEPGKTAEQNGSCYTGFCIPAEVCGVF